MLIRVCLLAVFAGIVARGCAVDRHELPRGDVLLDVGMARSLAAGEGFDAGYDRGVFFDLFDTEPPEGTPADQRSPLWPLVGALLSPLAGSAFGGLQLGSLLCGVALLLLVLREADRLVEGVSGVAPSLPALCAATVALSFVAIDASGNGSLYAAQAFLFVLLPALLAAPRPSPLAVGLALGAALLLNPQNAALLAVPPLVLALAPHDGRRAAGLLRGLLAVGVALACQAPWWWRNAIVFGHPLYSTNAAYFLVKAGVDPLLTIEDGTPVLRFASGMTPAVVLGSVRYWLGPNLLYLASTGAIVFAGWLGLVGAGAAPLAARALRAGDRRALALLATLGAGLAVVLLWPGVNLRYLVPFVAPVALLGTRLLARRPGRAERAFGALFALAWVALLALSLEDLQGAGDDPRPRRWWTMAGGGAALVFAPLAVWLFDRTTPGFRRVVCSGLVATPLLSAIALFPPAPHPGTTYTASILTPDAHGEQAAELTDAVEARQVEVARAAALGAGARRVAGPIELLAAPAPELVALPPQRLPESDAVLALLIESRDCDHAITFLDQWWRGHDLLLEPGERWLDGRLEVVGVFHPEVEAPEIASTVLSRVVR